MNQHAARKTRQRDKKRAWKAKYMELLGRHGKFVRAVREALQELDGVNVVGAIAASMDAVLNTPYAVLKAGANEAVRRGKGR